MEKFVDIAVCGKFHILNYIPFLEKSGVINHLYFSHKSTTAQQFGISDEVARNFPLKEYLTQGHSRVFGMKFTDKMWPLYGKVWGHTVNREWEKTEILHILAHGHCVELVQKAKKQGSRIIAEVVNTHPENLRNAMASEAEKWGCVPMSRTLSKQDQRILKEVELCDVLLTPTRTVANSYLSRGIRKRVEIIPYAANISRFYVDETASTQRTHRDELKIVCVGQICLRKGQLYLLEVARRLGIKVTLVGSINEELGNSLEPYQDHFEHIERVPSEEMRDFLLQHDIFVLPSLEEGLAVVLCEAMACGLAVVTTNEAGGEEILEDGKTGLIVNAGSADDLEDKLKDLLANPDKSVQIGQEAAKATRNYHNWEQYAARLENVYRSLI